MPVFSLIGPANVATPDSASHVVLGLRSLYQANEGTDPTAGNNEVQFFAGTYVGGPFGAVGAEELNTLTSPPTATSGSISTASRNPFLVVSLNAVTRSAWRGDWRRYPNTQSGDPSTYGLVNSGQANVSDAFNFYEENHLTQPSPPQRRYLRRGRTPYWFFCDSVQHFYKKTGSGAFELTSRPHMGNDGLTWVDGRAWRFGNAQADFWDINLFGISVPQTFSQSFTANFSPTATLTKSITQSGFTAALSFIGNVSVSRLFTRTFTAVLNFNRLTDGDRVTVWADQSGNGNDATQASDSFKPIFKTNIVNGKPVVRGDGVDDNLVFASSAFTLLQNVASATLIVVCSDTNNAGGDATHQPVFFNGGTGGSRMNIRTRQATTSGFHAISRRLDGDANAQVGPVTFVSGFHVLTNQSDWANNLLTLFVDGTSAGTAAYPSGAGNTSNTAGTTAGVFNAGGFEMPGDIAEVLLFVPALTSTQRANVEKNVANKYGLTVAGGTDTDPSTYSPKIWLKADSLPLIQVILTKQIGKSLSAGFSSTAVLTKKITDAGFTATLSFVGSLTKQTSRSLTAALSFVGNLSFFKFAVRAFTATLSFSGALSRRTGKSFSATLSFVGALVKRITDAGFTATLSFVGLLTKQIPKSFTATLFVGGGAGYSRILTVDHTKVPSSQTDFPVLVSITDATLKSVANGGHVQRSDGFDIGFYSDVSGTTKLKWEMERYNPSTGEIVAWVKIPSLSSGTDTQLYLFYGNPAITTDQSDPANVWTSSFLGVYHLKDGTTLSVNSSTGSNNGTNNGATAATGQIDGGSGFVSASSQYINLGTGMNPTQITMSAWVKATSFPNAYNSIVLRNSSGAQYSGILVKSTGKLDWAIGINSTDKSADGTGTNTLSSGTWYYLTLTYETSAGLIGYVNAGVDATKVGGVALAGTVVQCDIGRDNFTAGRFWNGTVDEVRITSVARSADWITTEYNNQNAPSSFLSLGTESVSGPIASLSRKAIKSLPAAALSMSGALSRQVGKTFSATLSFVGNLSNRIGKAFSASLSFVGTLATNLIHGGGTLFTQSFTATLSFSASLSTLVGHFFTKSFTATLSFVGALNRKTARNLTATLSFTGALVKKMIKSGFTATLSFTGALTKSTVKSFNATLSFAASLIKRIARTLTAALSFVGALVKAIRDAGFTATLSFSASLTTSIVHFFTRAFTATLSFSGNLTRSLRFSKVFAATLSFSGALSRKIGKTFGAVLSVSGALRKLTRKTFTATLSFIGNLFKGVPFNIWADQIRGSVLKIFGAGSAAKAQQAQSKLQIFKTGSTSDIQQSSSELDGQITTTDPDPNKTTTNPNP